MKFRATSITIREFDTLTIIFKDKETIWILPNNASTNIVFNRWFAPRGSYSAGWQDFRRKLFRNKRVSLEYCYKIAKKHQIQSMGTTRSPSFRDEIITIETIKGGNKHE